LPKIYINNLESTNVLERKQGYGSVKWKL